MTPFRLEHEFCATPALYWRAFCDSECARAQYELVGVRSFEIMRWDDEGDTFVRSVRVTPRRDFPGFMRKVLGTSLSFTETTTLYRQDGYAETRVTPDMMASRVGIAGKHTLIETGPDRVTRVFEGQIEVAIPLVGGRIEQVVYDDMVKSYQQSSTVSQSWIDRWAASS